MSKKSSERIYLGYDNRWHVKINCGIKDDGSTHWRHISSGDKNKVTTKLHQIEKDLAEGHLTSAEENWTVDRWLSYWLENLARPYVKQTTYLGYSVAVNKHLIPGIGKHKLRTLRAEHLEKLYLKILAQPTKMGPSTSPATVHQIHRTCRTALNEAMNRGYIKRNPAKIAKTPRLSDNEIEPYSVTEIQQLFLAAGKSRNAARWVIALALGLRQGEVLGLTWSDLDLENRVLKTRRNSLRPIYKHGCDRSCQRKYAGYCPHRVRANPETDETKSRAGRRRIALPEPLCRLFELHRATQESERITAGTLWADSGRIFTNPDGSMLSSRTDWSNWKALIAKAGLRDSRLHDARHTAATILLMLDVHEHAMMAIMGWSTSSMANRYTHVTGTMKHDVAAKIENLLWGSAS